MHQRTDYPDVSRAKKKKAWEIYVKEKARKTKTAENLNSSIVSSLCQQLKCMRKNKRYTQGDVAKLLHVTPSVISRIEAGHYTLSLQLLTALSTALTMNISISTNSVTLIPAGENE